MPCWYEIYISDRRVNEIKDSFCDLSEIFVSIGSHPHAMGLHALIERPQHLWLTRQDLFHLDQK